MSLAFIRKTYNVPAERYREILFQGKRVVITGSRFHQLRVRDNWGNRYLIHPTWEVNYWPDGKPEPSSLKKIYPAEQKA